MIPSESPKFLLYDNISFDVNDSSFNCIHLNMLLTPKYLIRIFENLLTLYNISLVWMIFPSSKPFWMCWSNEKPFRLNHQIADIG
jgi:hypothetical protein